MQVVKLELRGYHAALELDPQANGRRSAAELRRGEFARLLHIPKEVAVTWANLEQVTESEVAVLRALLGGRPIWSSAPRAMLLILLALWVSAAGQCSQVEICHCQAQCVVSGVQLSTWQPDCGASLNGNPVDVIGEAASREYDALVQSDEDQALCDLLRCRRDCLENCPELESFREQCSNVQSLLHGCSVDCGQTAEVPASRELALCLVGQLRGVCQAEDFSSLFDVFLANFASVDVFLVFPDTSCAEDVALFEKAADLHDDLRIFPLCQSDDFWDPVETHFVDWFKGHEWWATVWHNMTRLRNIMLWGKHVAACAAAVDATQAEYRFVARARPDVKWVSFIQRAELEKWVPGHVLTNFVAMPIQGVAEDTFALGVWSDMKKYFAFYTDQLLDIDRLETTLAPWCVVHATLRNRAHCQRIFPENLIEEHLRRHQHVQIQKRQEICFERVAPCMQERNHYCTRYKQHARGFLQSHPKDYLLLDRDFFLTASGSYADYDTVLAARLVHFLLAESSGLGHPARVVDMGCGRGSYVEFFKSWGLPVVGIDGNAVITRSIRFNSFLYDLTTPLDLKEAFAKDSCDFSMLQHGSLVEKEYAEEVASTMGFGPLQLSLYALVPRIQGSYFRASKHPEGHASESLLDQETVLDYLRTVCCADKRCAAFSLTSEGGVLLTWQLVNAQEPASAWQNEGATRFAPVDTYIWYQVRGAYVVNSTGFLEIAGPGNFLNFQLQHAEMEPQFSSGDWILSLGLGSEVPRMGEKVLVKNLARNAEQGVILSWGQGRNKRSQAEVLELFEAYGYQLDAAASDSLRLFSGLLHAPEREDLLVLRKRQTQQQAGAQDVELIDEWGGLRCHEATAKMQHGLQGKTSQFGPLGHGRMWTSGGCVGRFRAGAHGKVILCSSQFKKFMECSLPGFIGAEERGPDVDSIEASALYDAADHMVPAPGVWLGDPRLNLVFFKIARAIAAPFRIEMLHSAWTWFWSTSWPLLIANAPEPHRIFTPWTKPLAPGVLVWQTGRVLLALYQLSCRLQSKERTTRGAWGGVQERLAALEESVGQVGAPEMLIQQLADLQSEVNASLQGLTAKEALLDTGFSELLPRLRQLMFSPAPEDSGGLGLKEAGCEDPVWKEPVNVASIWDKESVTGWYLYRLAAVDPTMLEGGDFAGDPFAKADICPAEAIWAPGVVYYYEDPELALLHLVSHPAFGAGIGSDLQAARVALCVLSSMGFRSAGHGRFAVVLLSWHTASSGVLDVFEDTIPLGPDLAKAADLARREPHER
ncbi:unnamed protein product [Effrenium voratum]|nr:unnamed protein product [Effrenium voratum]